MKFTSFFFVLCCLLVSTSINAQAKSCSRADVAKCAKAAGMSIEECAKKCFKSTASISKSESKLVDAKPTTLTAEQKSRVASALLESEDVRLKSYKCAAKASCTKTKASKVVVTNSTQKKAVKA
jgi:hypothetical protein